MRLRYQVAYQFGDTIIQPVIACDDWRYNDMSKMHIFLRRSVPHQPSDTDDIVFAVSERAFITAVLVEEENAD